MEDIIKSIQGFVLQYGILIITIIITVVMSLARTRKANGKVDWLEALMCAIFAYAIWLLLEWFKLPEDASVLVGTFIAYQGTHAISEKIENWLGLDKKK